MSARSCSMASPPFSHPSISVAAKGTAPDLLGWSSEEEEDDEGDSYAELWRQILQLTSDEDENPAGSMMHQGSCLVAAPSPVSGSGQWMDGRNVEPSPAWPVSPPTPWSGSGTGVFIPRVTATGEGDCQVREAMKKKKKKKAKKPVQKKWIPSRRGDPFTQTAEKTWK
ncbi:hypothetical protein ACJRO7_028382 [Eucalyptus globulus]|uniref:Uncharacterized protein n=1 Tax=Eucalyptus globulus TaxID=34317 RepID=A0ABD3JUB3_EUCGL